MKENIVGEDFSSIETASNTVTNNLTTRSYDNHVSSASAVEATSAATSTATATATATSIRKWGCHRQEAPFIFVHIGKAGGGGVRVRIAASALNYTRDSWKDVAQDDHYYPIGNQQHRGKLCSSLIRHHRVPESTFNRHSYEGLSPCNATTPLGMAIACPQTKTNRGTIRCLGCNDLKSTDCNTVYLGHNHLGSEIHWLPPRILKSWWNDHWKPVSSSMPFDTIDNNLDNLLPGNKKWCSEYNRPRPKHMKEKERWYMKCSVPLSNRMDAVFNQFWKEEQAGRPHEELESSDNRRSNFGPLYASLPVQRVTLLREPFGWLLSKFSWHHVGKKEEEEPTRCDDLTRAATGWAHDFSVTYMLYLCGVDCINRYDHGMVTLQEIEQQAAYNLRNSFSVVGLLNETADFYDMISTRVAYIDTYLNPSVQGENHPSTKTREIKRCTQKFQRKRFQKRFLAVVPALAAVQRLYELGVAVNRFQQHELNRCKHVRMS